MRAAMFFSVFLLQFLNLNAQNSGHSMSIAYFSPFGNQFGGKISIQKKLDKLSGNIPFFKEVYLSPQIITFTRPKIHTNGMVNFEIGSIKQVNGKKFFIAPALGIGYLISSRIVGGSTHLGNGEFKKDKETWSSVVPTLSISLGSRKGDSLGYYFKPFYGRNIYLDRDNSGFFGLEIGMSFDLKSKSSN